MREDGASRTVYDTACESIYSIVLYRVDALECMEICYLADVARSRTSAEALFAHFVDGAVTPTTAREIMEELLAR